jgi:hypothetical protein
MARKIRIKTQEDDNIHFDFGRNEYTLCGLDTMGDPTLGIEVPKVTDKKVDCPTCIAIVKYCKSIKSTEF